MNSQLISELDARGVLTLTLNRPEVHNAFNAGLITELHEALDEAESNESVRAVVLTGAGSSFSAGADLEWMRSQVEAGEEENRADAARLADMLRALNYLPHPTIARVNGHAFGGGVGLVACCDIAIASRDAMFGLTEARLGLAPAIISPYVIRCIGERQARRWFLTGARFGAEAARDMGLLHELRDKDSLDEAVESEIAELLLSGPDAVRASKKLVFDSSESDRQRQEELDLDNAALIARLRVSTEGQEGLSAFLEKRRPGWQNRK